MTFLQDDNNFAQFLLLFAVSVPVYIAYELIIRCFYPTGEQFTRLSDEQQNTVKKVLKYTSAKYKERAEFVASRRIVTSL